MLGGVLASNVQMCRTPLHDVCCGAPGIVSCCPAKACSQKPEFDTTSDMSLHVSYFAIAMDWYFPSQLELVPKPADVGFKGFAREIWQSAGR